MRFPLAGELEGEAWPSGLNLTRPLGHVWPVSEPRKTVGSAASLLARLADVGAEVLDHGVVAKVLGTHLGGSPRSFRADVSVTSLAPQVVGHHLFAGDLVEQTAKGAEYVRRPDAEGTTSDNGEARPQVCAGGGDQVETEVPGQVSDNLGLVEELGGDNVQSPEQGDGRGAVSPGVVGLQEEPALVELRM